MNFRPIDPPREYEVGRHVRFRIRDCGRLDLRPDEQVTLTTEAGAEYDVTRKDWGFYATPSLNGRLPKFGLQGVLVRNLEGRFFLLLLEKGKEAEFDRYMANEELRVVCRLDDDHTLEAIADATARRDG